MNLLLIIIVINWTGLIWPVILLCLHKIIPHWGLLNVTHRSLVVGVMLCWFHHRNQHDLSTYDCIITAGVAATWGEKLSAKLLFYCLSKAELSATFIIHRPLFEKVIASLNGGERNKPITFIAARFSITDDPNVYNITERGKEVFQLKLARIASQAPDKDSINNFLSVRIRRYLRKEVYVRLVKGCMKTTNCMLIIHLTSWIRTLPVSKAKLTEARTSWHTKIESSLKVTFPLLYFHINQTGVAREDSWMSIICECFLC